MGRLDGIPVVVAVGIPPVLMVVDDCWKRLEVGIHSVFETVAVGNKLVKTGGLEVGVVVVVGVVMIVGDGELVLEGRTIMLLDTIDSEGAAVVVGTVVLELTVGDRVSEAEVTDSKVVVFAGTPGSENELVGVAVGGAVPGKEEVVMLIGMSVEAVGKISDEVDTVGKIEVAENDVELGIAEVSLAVVFAISLVVADSVGNNVGNNPPELVSVTLPISLVVVGSGRSVGNKPPELVSVALAISLVVVGSLGNSVGSKPPELEVSVSVALAISLVVAGSLGNNVGRRPPPVVEVEVGSVALVVTSLVVESVGSNVGKRPPDEVVSLVGPVLVAVALAVVSVALVVVSLGGSSVGKSPPDVDSVVCDVADSDVPDAVVSVAVDSVALVVAEGLRALVIGSTIPEITPPRPPPELVVS